MTIANFMQINRIILAAKNAIFASGIFIVVNWMPLCYKKNRKTRRDQQGFFVVQVHVMGPFQNPRQK
jgi:hypothetical protein